MGKVEYPVFGNGLPFFGVEEGFGYLDAFFRVGNLHLSKFFEPVFQRDPADVLDFEPGAGVDFEEFRTVGRNDPVEREVSEVGEQLDFRRV